MPTTLVRRQARGLLQRPNHRIERVGDADDEGVRRIRLDARADRIHDLEIDAEQIVAAHAGLARHAGGDDDDVRAGDFGVGTGARQFCVKPVDRRGFREIERLALRHPVDNVEQDDVAEFLQRGQMGQRSADLACADQRYLFARHELCRPCVSAASRAAGPRPVLSPHPASRSSRTFGERKAIILRIITADIIYETP